jgi:hypothetical protein
MTRHHHIAVFAAVVLLSACQAPVTIDEGTVAGRQSAIVNGQVYNGHPSVGRLQIGMGGLCTATLVGKKTVLTAAHCIKPGSSHTFHVGGQSYTAAQTIRHPQYNGYSLTNDIALVLLQSAPPITPSAIATSNPNVGLQVTLVGYGVTSENGTDSGIKRIAKNTIAQMSATKVVFLGSGGDTGNTCYGDSGGPAFSTLNGSEVVVGVTSGGSPPCGSDGVDTRVDAFQSWLVQSSGGDIQQGSTTPPPPPPPPADTQKPQVVITSPQSGVTLGATQATIKVAATDNKAVTKVELRIGSAVVASLSAPPFDFAVQLPEGNVTFTAVAYDAAGNQASATASVTVTTGKPDPGPDPKPDPNPNPSPSAFGLPCGGPADCQSGLCADDGSGGGKYCTQTCNATMNNCPQQAECLPASTNNYVCGRPQSAPTPTPPTPGPGDNGSQGLAGGELVGSCALAGVDVSTPPLSLLVLLGLALCLRRRRPGR